MKKAALYAGIFGFGAVCYGAIELAFRGWTHWSMPPLGGLCLCVIYRMSERYRGPKPVLWLMGAAVITTLEFVSGAVLNCFLGLNVWDYGGHAFNLYGQICPLFSFFWYLLCIPACALCSLARRLFGAKI